MTDGRKNNRPAPPPRKLTDECVWAIDEMVAMTMTAKAIAKRIGVHHRTVHYAVNRKGAYAVVPKGNAGDKPPQVGLD